MSAPVGRFARRGHDHDDCVRHALAEAETLCAANGARLTSLRRQVLELVWESHTPLGAYELLAMLKDAGRPAGPPTVYRAVDDAEMNPAAKSRIERAKALEPEQGSIREALGRAYFSSRAFVRARAEFEAAVELHPTDGYAHYGLARSLDRLGERRLARRHYRLAKLFGTGADGQPAA